MALEAPAPRIASRRLTEKGKSVVPDVARKPRAVERPQDLLELHDLYDLEAPSRAQHARQKGVKPLALSRVHVAHGKTFAWTRPVRPVDSRVVAHLVK